MTLFASLSGLLWASIASTRLLVRHGGKDALPDTPERGCSELIGTCATLRDAVRKTSTHMVDEEVGEEIHSLVGKRGTRVRRGAAGNHLASGKRRRVAVDTTCLCENGLSIHGG